MPLVLTPPPPVPSPDRPDTFDVEMDAYLRWMKTNQQELSTFADSVSQYGRNVLDNGALQVAQRFTASTAVADDTYALDRFYALTQTASVNASQLTAPEDGYSHAMRLSQSQASAQRMGFAQIVEGRRCKHLRGKSAVLVPRVRISNAQAIRYAILTWTGTEDAVTSDVVNSWTNATFTAGQFFISSSLSVVAVGAQTPAANTWTSLAAITGALGSTFNNLIVMVWTEGTAAQNVTLDVDFIQLEEGANATPPDRVPYAIELQRCQRYCYVWRVLTGSYWGWGRGVRHAADSKGYGYVPLPAALRAIPTVTPSGSFGFIADNATNQGSSSTVAELAMSSFTLVVMSVTCSGLSGELWGNAGAYNDSTAKLTIDSEL